MYITNDGKHFWFTSEKELVEKLQADSFTPTVTIQEFMTEVSIRAFVQTGAMVRINSVEKFVADLVAAGLLVKVNSN